MVQANREFPTLTTERFRLRAPHMDDAEAFGLMLAIPEVTRYSNLPEAPKPAEVERMVRFMSKLHATRKGCAWIIEDAASARLVGAIRFNHFDRRWRVGEIGYESHPNFWSAA